MKHFRSRVLACLAVSICFLLGLPVSTLASAANGTLGLAFTNTDSKDVFVSNLHGGQSLWFVVAPGASQSRELLISSSGTVPERVLMSLGFLAQTAARQYLDPSKKADSSDWVSFTPSDFVLQPHTTQSVTMNFTIPSNVHIGSHTAYVLATADSESKKTTAQYSVPQAIAISRPLFLGVGTNLDMAPEILIQDLLGTNFKGVNYLTLQVKNTGKVPFSFAGTIDLVDSRFGNRKFSNLRFQSEPLAPNQSTRILIPKPTGFSPGKYDVSLQAVLGSQVINKIWLSKLIRFSPIIPIFQILVRVGFALFFIIIIAFCVRFLRRSEKKVDDKKAEDEALSTLLAPPAKKKAPAKPLKPTK